MIVDIYDIKIIEKLFVDVNLEGNINRYLKCDDNDTTILNFIVCQFIL